MQKVRDMLLKSTRYSANLRSGGFSLLEVLIALAILGVSVVSVFQLFSITLRSTKKAEDYTQALLYAQSLLDEAYSSSDPADSPVTVRFGKGYQGSRQVQLKSASEDGTIRMYEITASVSWQPAGSLRITALRSVYVAEK
jgi:general secretion pathway protein I